MKYAPYPTHQYHPPPPPPPPPPQSPLHHRFHHLLPSPPALQPQPYPNYSHYETTLIDEVLYLHSLWRRGPPSAVTTATRNPYLNPTPTTHFKKKRQVSLKEWPAPDPVPSPHDGPGWPAFPTKGKPNTRPATDEERVRVLGAKIQFKGVESCACLFEGEEEGEEEEDDGDDEEEVDFFENLFEENKELREFYVRNCEGSSNGTGGGEFVCLVCGNGTMRRYKNCLALVQHSITVSKTKRKKAHRAYGNVVCKVLGWDVDRLPSLSTPSGVGGEVGSSQSMEKTSVVVMMKDDVKNPADGGSAGVEMEKSAALSEPSQTKMETNSDAPEAENVTSTGVEVAVELTPHLGEMKNHAGVELQRNTAVTEASQTEMETIPGALETENVTGEGVGCIADESEKKGSPESQQRNDPDPDPGLDEEVVNKKGDGCPIPENKAEELGDDHDPFEQLPSLPGAFEIPE